MVQRHAAAGTNGDQPGAVAQERIDALTQELNDELERTLSQSVAPPTVEQISSQTATRLATHIPPLCFRITPVGRNTAHEVSE